MILYTSCPIGCCVSLCCKLNPAFSFSSSNCLLLYRSAISTSLKSPSSSISTMEDRKDQKNAPWLSVPQFGDWDQKGPVPDYSMDFSKIREMRKQNKRDLSRASIGNEDEFINPTATTVNTAPSNDHHGYPQNHHAPTTRRSIFSCFNCCVKA